MLHREFFEPDLNRWLAVTVVPLHDEKGSVVSTLHFIQDVTEKRRFEEVRMLARKFETAMTIAGGIAHDFNNLLMIIAGNVEIAQKDISPDSPAYDKLSRAKEAVFRAADLVRRLLYATMHIHPHLCECDLNTLLPVWLADIMKKSPCRYDLTSYIEDARVIADPELLRRAFENVVKNAEEATGGKGGVKVSLWNRSVSASHPTLKGGSYIVVEIKDSGPGIKPELLYRVFDPYYSTKQRGTQKGMGLGLAESLSIMSAMGGTVEITSTEGSGTSVYLYIPKKEEETTLS
ncbi:two-component system sensor histidine kinase NtrB [Thermodesulforhabdus norvegica]|uniref:histidine kinase n=1 Tax=Thermodesulforhabdus norvegica TaxID=39841 RepID=A0A1I4RCI0_9BACT|nr:ATP-binding protein [Thermodesulforhabdus norvegica]SFM49746.1 Signal transduction histidine kinase [Thermodesulforhabdus norvegica]